MNAIPHLRLVKPKMPLRVTHTRSGREVHVLEKCQVAYLIRWPDTSEIRLLSFERFCEELLK
ncbi:hypothetical protein [Methyloterricola oryzae]|uniref:hypothetical protein n=1 Tax=Methyloterricola oryzae TaxID=1495050 RepID=UPI0005EB5799|nr:hypothetical protein [Methyloterricola oryzae]